jgi:hypothetical protein
MSFDHRELASVRGTGSFLNATEQHTVNESDTLSTLVLLSIRNLGNRSLTESRSRGRLSLLSRSDSSSAELSSDESFEETTSSKNLTVIGRSVETDEGSIGVEVVHAGKKLS